MRKGLLVLAWVSIALWGQGCIVICADAEDWEPCCPHVDGPDGATIREIDAVSDLAFDKDRAATYEQIARREGLSEQAQIHLIEASLRHLSFENAKVEVLLALMENPSFTPTAKAVLLDRLDRLAFDQDRRRILARSMAEEVEPH